MPRWSPRGRCRAAPRAPVRTEAERPGEGHPRPWPPAGCARARSAASLPRAARSGAIWPLRTPFVWPFNLDQSGTDTGAVTRFYAVFNEAGPTWNHGTPLRQQDAWSAHAVFMNALADEGFVV